MQTVHDELGQIIDNLLLIKNNTDKISSIEKDILLQNLREAYLAILRYPVSDEKEVVENQEEKTEEPQKESVVEKLVEEKVEMQEEEPSEEENEEMDTDILEFVKVVPKAVFEEKSPIQKTPDLFSESAPVSEPVKKEVPEPVVEAKPEPVAAPEPEPIVEPEAEKSEESESVEEILETEPIPEPKKVVAPEPVVESKPEPVVVPEPEPIVESEAEKSEESESVEEILEPEPIPEPEKVVAPEPVVEVKPEPVVVPEPEPIPEPVKAVEPEPVKVVTPEPVVESKPDPVVAPEPEPEPKVFTQPQPKVEVKPQQRSLNDLFNEQKQDLGEKFQQTKITDLTKAMSINDKFLFIRELFKNKSEEFSHAIHTLNNCENIEEAFDTMEGLKKQYFWDSTSSAYLALCDLVRRKF